MPLHDLVDVIYEEIESEMKDIIYVVVDVVSEVIQVESIDDVLSKDPQEFGFALLGENNTS
jgi:hypothetical protein